MINIMPYYNVTATIYENGLDQAHSTKKQTSVKGLKDVAVDYDTIKAFTEKYITDTYGSLDGITYEIVKPGSNPTNIPQTYGVETTNWNNMQFYVAVVIDSDYTFVAVLNDNGTKNAAQMKQYGVMNDVIDYEAVKTWAQEWADEKYVEAENVVEIKSVSNTDDLPATLGDRNFNWWSPDKYYANVNVTSTYDVAYVLDGASFGGDKVTVAEFPTYTVKDAGTKTGYTFSGWYKTQEELDAIEKVADIDLSKSVTSLEYGKYTLYGKFVANPVKINVYTRWTNEHDPDVTIFAKTEADDDTIVYDTVIATYLDAQNVAALVLTPAGYSWDSKFYMFNNVPELVEVTDQTAVFENDVFALFTPNQYKIIYNGNGGAKTNGAVKTTSNVTFDAPYTIKNASTFARRGYTFLGWSEAADDTTLKYFGSESFKEYKTVGNEEYFAQWEVNVYDITYVLNDDESVSKADNSANVTTYTVEDTVTLAAPERAGYTFLGWYDNQNFEGDAITEFSDEIDDKTFYAKWEVIVYSITYVMNDGESVSQATNPNAGTTTYTVEDTFTLEDAARKGYTFLGWTEDGEETTGIEAGEIGDRTFDANWEVIVYTITYVMNDGNSVSPATNPNAAVTTYTVEDSLTLAAATRKGYTWKGWTEDGVATTGFEAGTIGNKTFDANWEVIVYKITYDLNYAATTQSVPSNNNSNVKKYTVEDNVTFYNPGRRGYTFTKWTENGSKTTGFKAGTIGNKTIVANWSLNVYKVTYVLNGGLNDGNNVTTYTVEDAAHRINPARWIGMSFGGWFTDANMTANSYFDCIERASDGDIVLYAKWMNLAHYLPNRDIVLAPVAPIAPVEETADEPTAEQAEEPAEVVAPSEWAAEEVKAAVENGLVPEELCDKYTDGITRGELAKMLKKLLDAVYGKEAETADAKFGDTDDADVLYAANLGIIKGYETEDGFNFKPENTLKRSEITAIVNRVAALCGVETAGYEEEVKFEDTVEHWCGAELGWPVHAEIVKGTSEKTFSPENTLTREQAIMIVYRTFSALKPVEAADAE